MQVRMKAPVLPSHLIKFQIKVVDFGNAMQAHIAKQYYESNHFEVASIFYRAPEVRVEDPLPLL